MQTNENLSPTVETSAEFLMPDEETHIVSPECARDALSSNISDEEVIISSERSLIVSSEKSTSPEKIEPAASVLSSSSANSSMNDLLGSIDQADLNEENSLNELSSESIPSEPVIEESESSKVEETDESVKELSNTPSAVTLDESACVSESDNCDTQNVSHSTVFQDVTLNDETLCESDIKENDLDEGSNNFQSETIDSEMQASMKSDENGSSNDDNSIHLPSGDPVILNDTQSKDEDNGCDDNGCSIETEQFRVDFQECSSEVRSLVDSLCDHVDSNENNLLEALCEPMNCSENSLKETSLLPDENKFDSEVQDAMDVINTNLKDNLTLSINNNIYSHCSSMASNQTQVDNILPQLPPTPQTPASNHSHQHECHSSGEDFSNSENIPSPINKRSLCHLKTNSTVYDQYNNDEEEMHPEYETSQHDEQETENSCYTSPPSSLSTPGLLRKNATTPDITNLGVYTPDSSTNSGYNSVDVDTHHLSLESPSSVNSNELPQQNSVESLPQASTPQSCTDQLQTPVIYCSAKQSSRTPVVSAHTEPVQNNTKCSTISLNSNTSSQIHQHINQQHHTTHQQPATSYPQHPASAALTNMVNNNNSVGTLLLGSTTPVAPSNNYVTAVNVGMPSSHPGAPSSGSYLVGVPMTSVIQPQPASMSHHHSHHQNTNQPSHGSMQRLSHISMPAVTSSCAVSSHAYHLQSPNYTYSNASAPNQGTSCSIAKLQQLTNGIVELPQNNQISNYAPTPSSFNSPTHQSTITPPPQMQRPIAPAISNLPSQPSLSTNQAHGYTTNYNHRYHTRPMQRPSDITIGSNIVTSYPTFNGVSYRMQTPPLGGGTTLLNTATGYITNAGFISSSSPAMQMGVVNMHAQSQYPDAMQQVRQPNTMYYGYINSSVPPTALNSMMRR